jgi:hypothetical protein
MNALSATMAMTIPLAYFDPGETAVATAQEQSSGTIVTVSNWEVPLIVRLIELAQRHPTTVTPELVDRAIRLLHQIAAFDLELESFASPFIGPVSNGGIIFEWARGSRELSLALLPEGTTQYLKWEASEQFEEGELPPRAPGRVRELITWLTSGGAGT